MDSRRVRRRRVSPPLVTLAIFLLFFCAAALLNLAAPMATAESRTFVRSVSWGVWRAVASAAIVLFLVLLVVAVRILRHPQQWGLLGAPRRLRNYLLLAIVAIGAFATFMVSNRASPDLPVRALGLRTLAVLLAGLLASVPWLALVWLAHAECEDLSVAVSRLPGKDIPESTGAAGDAPPTALAASATPVANVAGSADGVSEEDAGYGAVVGRLLDVWQLMTTCVGAFALGVVAAILSSGALRAAFVAEHPRRAGEFPPSNVLLYGAFFAVILTVITLPLAFSWRTRARQLVQRAYPLPPDGRPTEAWVAARGRLEKLLHLDVSLLRNPLTALSIFTPLITAALAAFIPQLGGG